MRRRAGAGLGHDASNVLLAAVAGIPGALSVYNLGFYAALSLAVGLGLAVKPWQILQKNEAPGAVGSTDGPPSLAAVFLPAWYLCVAGDWLQGPFVYALYQSYDLPRADIARLFVAGFASSLVFGGVVGSWIDKVGRKRGCQLYCLLYMCSCATKHFANFWVLLFGRLTGGIATSLLFSAFESWLIREHAQRERGSADDAPDSAGLSRTLGLMWSGSSLVAIAAGFAGDVVVGDAPLTPLSFGFNLGGLTAAFDLAIFVLVLGLAFLTFTWPERDGMSKGVAANDDSTGPSLETEQGKLSPMELLRQGTSVIVEQPQLQALMGVITGFEAATYAFVFNWTPALAQAAGAQGSVPGLGGIFSTFMLAYTAGSLAFQWLGSTWDPPSMLRLALWLGSLALLAPASALGLGLFPTPDAATAAVLGGFIAFEFCCGLYAPAVAAVKGKLVPDTVRSTVYNAYRTPMNAAVLVVLLSDASCAEALVACVTLLLVAGVSSLGLPSSWPPLAADIPRAPGLPIPDGSEERRVP